MCDAKERSLLSTYASISELDGGEIFLFYPRKARIGPLAPILVKKGKLQNVEWRYFHFLLMPCEKPALAMLSLVMGFFHFITVIVATSVFKYSSSDSVVDVSSREILESFYLADLPKCHKV